jgi:predicted dehydrogenase
MNSTYKVIVVGMGKRGKHHAAAFHANPRFEIAGICDIDRAKAESAAPQLGNPMIETDAAKLAMSVKPDVFCFCTLPSIRLELIKLALKCRARLIAFEKPVALSSREAMKIRKLIETKGIKAVVSHQHRYGEHYRKLNEIISSGKLGRVHTVYGTASGWMMHMLSHLIDYMRWYNNDADAEWVMGQAAGRGKFADIHSSPDYIGGFIQFSNGVRGIVECGGGAPDVPEVDYWWRKCRIGAQGTEGYAEALTGGGWRAVTKTGSMSGGGCMNYDADMPPYIQEMADWLDDDGKIHSCNFAGAYKGFEIMMGLCRSAAEGGQIALPLVKGADELKALQKKIPERKLIASNPANAKEYGV